MLLVTVLAGVPAIMGVESQMFELLAAPFLYPGSLAAWLIKGDDFRSIEEFVRFAVGMSFPTNALFGLVLGIVVGSVRIKLVTSGTDAMP